MKPVKSMKTERGFTLIELLVVVAIIGILSGIAFVSISGARESAYDTQIKSELSQVRSSAEMYYYDIGGTYGGNLEGGRRLLSLYWLGSNCRPTSTM